MFVENKNIYISYWILLITLLVCLMITVGGMTRLTDSGLSITEWNLISGIIPPLTYNKWENLFNLYKQIPEFKLLNSSMTLDEFKAIYWWEYIHRLLGRVIGIFYIVPLIFFTINKDLNMKSIINFYLIFLLICFQGFIGWYMVKSGLTERTDVSQYRLSAHLTLAFILLIFLLFNYFKFFKNTNTEIREYLPYNLHYLFLLLILLQISLGAFVSGLDAGQIYQTWPLMNQEYFPDDSIFKDLFTIQVFETPSLVQFIHRNIAYLIFIIFIFIFILVFSQKKFFYLRNITLLVLIFLIFQIVLGIVTVLNGAQILYAIMHQLGSIFLIIATSFFVFKNSRIS